MNAILTAYKSKAKIPKGRYKLLTGDEIAEIKQRALQSQLQGFIAHEMDLPLSSVGYHARKVIKQKLSPRQQPK